MALLVLLGLQLILGLITWMKQNQAIEAGKDEAIAKAALAVLVKTDAAKRIMAEVNAMTEAQVDEALKRLEET